MGALDPWAVAAAAAVVWLLAVGYRLVWRWRLRSIPLVRPMPFFLGHLRVFRRLPLYRAYEEWMHRYGGIFLCFMGKNPVVVLSDPDLIRQVAVKQFAKFHDRPSIIAMPTGRRQSRDKRLTAIRSGLLVARGGYWGSLRAAMAPLFHSTALQSYSSVMNRCVGRFLQRLQEMSALAANGCSGPAEAAALAESTEQPAAAEGDGKGGGGASQQQPQQAMEAAANSSAAVPAELDIHALLGRFTLEVVGQSAFGVEFITEGDEQDLKEGKPNLVAAVKAIFSAGNFTPSNGAGVLFRLVPNWMEPLFFVLFLRLFGAMARKLEYARSTLMCTADLLMQAAKKQALARGEKVHMVETDWRWWSQAWADQNPYKGVTPAPNSVLDMLMRATNKETGRGLTDVQIAAQSNTLIAAGYETTANALSFAIYCLATHPEAEARLLAEVDAFGADKEPTLDDAPRFPYVEAVMHEALRLYPPAHTTNRECTAPGGATLVGGDGTQYHIPQGVWVHFNIWGLHHSEAHWKEPHAFRPERFLDEEEVAGRHPNAFIPFGLGPRNCIGYKFALQEMLISLVRIYQRWTFQLAPRQARPLPLRMGITLAPKDGLWVTAHPRSANSMTAAA
ncbi:hypothetical protein COHA_008661 [Chlorella ohadii]|uniref:Cytochrome P450 n=1 Tax=Chlorella ohadii TaxID=2649997 RepID=A0AAD5DL24_9CHLO|nr:hypothetical protein COHA_008661 [Chlorella ohadii]